MTKASVTIIIPTYNRAQMVTKSINSARYQSYKFINILVLDNHSTDDTEEVVKKIIDIDDRVTYIKHSENIGAHNNFNHGLATVESDYFCFLSDDDLLLPDFLTNALKDFDRHEDIKMAISEVEYINKNYDHMGFSNSNLRQGYFKARCGLIEMIKSLGRGPTWTGILFKSDVISNVGLLDNNVGGASDFDFIYKYASLYSFCVNAKVGAIFLNHENSSSSQASFNTVWPSWLNMIENITSNRNVDKDFREQFTKIINEQLSEKIYYFAKQALKENNLILSLKAISAYKDNNTKNNRKFFTLKSIYYLLYFFPIASHGILFILKIKNILSFFRPDLKNKKSIHIGYIKNL